MAATELQPGAGLRIPNPAPVDAKYCKPQVGEEPAQPYASVAEACQLVPQPVRYRGLTVNVAGAEYWWPSDLSNTGLVVKSAAGPGGGTSLPSNIEAGLNAANEPSSENPFATLQDVNAGPTTDLTRNYIRHGSDGFAAFDTLADLLANHEQYDQLEFNAVFTDVPAGQPVSLAAYVEVEGNYGFLGLYDAVNGANYNVLRNLNVYQYNNTASQRKPITGQNLTLKGGNYDNTPLVLSGADNVLQDVVFAQTGNQTGYFSAGQYWLSSPSPATTTVRLRGYTVVPDFFLASVQPGITVVLERVLDNTGGPATPVRDVYDVSQTIRDAVTAGSFTNGELQGDQPIGSQAGMKFTTTGYGYEYQRGAGGALVWCRFMKL